MWLVFRHVHFRSFFFFFLYQVLFFSLFVCLCVTNSSDFASCLFFVRLNIIIKVFIYFMIEGDNEKELRCVRSRGSESKEKLWSSWLFWSDFGFCLFSAFHFLIFLWEGLECIDLSEYWPLFFLTASNWTKHSRILRLSKIECCREAFFKNHKRGANQSGKE